MTTNQKIVLGVVALSVIWLDAALMSKGSNTTVKDNFMSEGFIDRILKIFLPLPGQGFQDIVNKNSEMRVS